MMTPHATEEVFLTPGGFHFGGGRVRLRTLLGSCVAITLWHPHRRIGGMCHYMLPEREGARPFLPDGRYAHEAMDLFDREMARAGTLPNEYQAKIFGGGNMFPGREAGLGVNLGRRNLSAAHELLAKRQIEVVAEHLGGDGHRKLVFDLWSGHAWLAFRQAAAPGGRSGIR